MGIPAGLIEGSLDMKISEHIFVESGADWFSFDDGAPQYPGPSPSSLEKRE